MIFYLLNAHIQPRKIWLCIHGETDNDRKGILGGDPELNENGILFSKDLHEFISSQGDVRVKSEEWGVEWNNFDLMRHFASCVPDH